jgi:hypothetical protein
MLRMTSGLVAVGILLFSGLCHGLMVGDTTIEDMNPVLAQIPAAVGDWQGKDLEDFAAVPGYAGALARRYQNRRTNEVVTILLMCGKPGLVSVHTPDVCFGASGYDVEKPVRESVLLAGSDEATFFAANMVKQKVADRTSLRIYWAWSAAGAWTVSDNPRITFAGRSKLFKLYVQRELNETRPAPQDPCVAFLREFLPEVQRVLFKE